MAVLFGAPNVISSGVPLAKPGNDDETNATTLEITEHVHEVFHVSLRNLNLVQIRSISVH